MSGLKISAGEVSRMATELDEKLSEILDWRVANSENEDSWGELFRSLKDEVCGA